MTKGPCEWILLTARFNLVQLHLLEENLISATVKAHIYTLSRAAQLIKLKPESQYGFGYSLIK